MQSRSSRTIIKAGCLQWILKLLCDRLILMFNINNYARHSLVNMKHSRPRNTLVHLKKLFVLRHLISFNVNTAYKSG